MPARKDIFDYEFERIKLKVWRFILTNYIDFFSAKEIATKLNEPLIDVQKALRKLSVEERTITNKKKQWSIRWPHDPNKHGPTVSSNVSIEWMLNLIQLAKTNKIREGTQMYDDAMKAYRVMVRYVSKQ